MRNFLEFVDGNIEPVVNCIEGAASLRLALAAKESMLKEISIDLSWE